MCTSLRSKPCDLGPGKPKPTIHKHANGNHNEYEITRRLLAWARCNEDQSGAQGILAAEKKRLATLRAASVSMLESNSDPAADPEAEAADTNVAEASPSGGYLGIWHVYVDDDVSADDDDADDGILLGGGNALCHPPAPAAQLTDEAEPDSLTWMLRLDTPASCSMLDGGASSDDGMTVGEGVSAACESGSIARSSDMV